MNPVGIDYLTLAGMHPIEFITRAAEAGAETVALPPFNRDPLPEAAAAYSIVADSGLRADMRALLDETGLRIGMIDCLAVHAHESVDRFEPVMAAIAEIGGTLVNTYCTDPDPDRSIEEIARLAELAAAYGVGVVLECVPILPIGTLAQARNVVRTINADNLMLTIDTMHVSRSGEADLVATIEPSLIGYVQLCDAPLAMPPSTEAYADEALHGRMMPGEGELPLLDILKAIPPEVIISVEAPLSHDPPTGEAARDLARSAVRRGRDLLRQARS